MFTVLLLIPFFSLLLVRGRRPKVKLHFSDPVVGLKLFGAQALSTELDLFQIDRVLIYHDNIGYLKITKNVK